MKRWYNIPTETKINAYTQIAENTGMAAFAVEKDWWVVQTLAIIFDMEIGQHLVFKGGTSLSKAWKLIERFSEDIDLAVDRNFLGFEGTLSKKQVTNLRRAANIYTSETFYPALQKKFKDIGLTDVTFNIAEAVSSDQDPRIIEIYYPFVIESPGYIQPRVQIEIGCRSMMEPFSIRSFSSLVDEYYPDAQFKQDQINIPVVDPQRTFLEKIFLLHEEFQRPSEKIRVDRLSRHLYDIYQIVQTDISVQAINDPTLYESLVKHRFNYTRVVGVDYNFHQPKHINPIPKDDFIEAWKQDYKTMQQEMIYGDSTEYEEMVNSIENFVRKINALDWKYETKFPKPDNQ